jgi:hypothetical protein
MKKTKQEERQIKTPNYSNPFVIKIKNNTDEKIYNVKLFNYEHEKQSKLKYEHNGIGDTNYNDLLRHISRINEGQMQIGITYLIVSCDYPKFKEKQLYSQFKMIHTDLNKGISSSCKDIFNIDPYQNQDIGIFKDVYEFSNRLQIEFDFIMPETDIIIQLYPIITI